MKGRGGFVGKVVFISYICAEHCPVKAQIVSVSGVGCPYGKML